ncbi:hypothetical protein AAFF_G00182740 [Aldrovandia affinis]|uniref:Uncharacterized protein n=1 Tax=Aldrovandia affinis TaxID=143900 RepID=A0AAD7RK40_9TELE|nr:hypothetical protein AAFF_G00182740 [Aldrovandia affinis]
MGDKHRHLPTWMLGGDVKRNKSERSVQSRKKTKRARVEREMLYFMNEAELVDVALCVVTEGRGTGIHALQTDAEKEAEAYPAKTNGDFVKIEKKRKLESDTVEESPDFEVHERTYVPETDPEDAAEEDIVPYAYAASLEPGEGEENAAPATSGTRGQGVSWLSGRDAEGSGPSRHGAKPEPDRRNSSLAASDDEALRLVREIFFT